MPPNDDVERPRASSGAERQKSIVSMTEFEGMDEFTALQKYILFYRDTRTNPHAEKTTKKKAWYEFWKSGSPTAAAPVEDSGAVPDERKLHSSNPSTSSSSCCIALRCQLRNARLCCGRQTHPWPHEAPSELKLLALRTQACCSCGGANQGRPTGLQQRPTELPPACSMRDEQHDSFRTSY
jgi:hypothetical protein